MISYLLHVGLNLGFVLVIVPGIFLAVFRYLVSLGLPPDLTDVWGLAVLGGTGVLLVLEALGWVFWKLRGSPSPRPAPEMPAWFRRTLWAGVFLVVGTVVLAGTSAGALRFLLGSWPRLDEAASCYLGELALTPLGTSGKGPYQAAFQLRAEVPAAAPLSIGDPEAIEVEVVVVSFSGPVGEALARIGVEDVALPFDLYQREVEDAAPGKVGALASRLDPLVEKTLAALAHVPGIEVARLRTASQKVKDGKVWGLLVEAGKARFVPARARPVAPPPPTQPPPRPAPKLDPGDDPFADPDDPSGNPVTTRLPTDRPTDPGTDLAAGLPRGPLPKELYPGDPFEGLD